jgi:hypothetical protein
MQEEKLAQELDMTRDTQDILLCREFLFFQPASFKQI